MCSRQIIKIQQSVISSSQWLYEKAMFLPTSRGRGGRKLNNFCYKYSSRWPWCSDREKGILQGKGLSADQVPALWTGSRNELAANDTHPTANQGWETCNPPDVAGLQFSPASVKITCSQGRWKLHPTISGGLQVLHLCNIISKYRAFPSSTWCLAEKANTEV